MGPRPRWRERVHVTVRSGRPARSPVTRPLHSPRSLALIPLHSPLRHSPRPLHSSTPQARIPLHSTSEARNPRPTHSPQGPPDLQSRARDPTFPARRPITLAAEDRTRLRQVLAPGRAPQHPQCSAAPPHSPPDPPSLAAGETGGTAVAGHIPAASALVAAPAGGLAVSWGHTCMPSRLASQRLPARPRQPPGPPVAQAQAPHVGPANPRASSRPRCSLHWINLPEPLPQPPPDQPSLRPQPSWTPPQPLPHHPVEHPAPRRQPPWTTPPGVPAGPPPPVTPPTGPPSTGRSPH